MHQFNRNIFATSRPSRMERLLTFAMHLALSIALMSGLLALMLAYFDVLSY